MSKRNDEKIWNKIYQEGPMNYVFKEDISHIVNLFNSNNVKTILDLGCGSGRYIELLSKAGFNTHGIDLSKEAVRIANNTLKDKNLNAKLVVGSMHKKLPYHDNFFDAAISIRSYHHGTLNEIRYGITELERILKSGGLIYITFRRKVSKIRRLPHKYIASRTYVPLEGNEKDIIHYFFNKRLIKREFHNFKLIKLTKSKDYYYFLGKKNMKNVSEIFE